MVYRFIEDYSSLFGVRWLLNKFHIYPNAYYNYRKLRKTNYYKNKHRIHEEIKSIYDNSNRIIGHRAMKIFLARKGIFLSKPTIHKYRNKELNLHSVVMRKKRAYIQGIKNKIAPNLLHQNFTVSVKNKVWCTDFTYIRLANGKLRYNCTIIDLYDRAVVATSNSRYINTELAIAQWLGHKQLEITLIYAYADTEAKRKVIEKAMGTEAVLGADDDEETLKRLYGL